jgi:DNA-directed RNA polymerase specialized sigma24 family protein
VLAADSARAADATDLQLLTRAIKAQLYGYRLDPSDAEDIAQEVITRTLARTGDLRMTISSPVAYLMTAARRAAFDVHRRQAREVPVDPFDGCSALYSRTDHSLAARFDGDATAEAIESAIRVAHAVDDHVAIRAVSVWLELAERLGETPTSRQVAEQAKMSHTSVNQALRRFRTYFPQRGSGPSNP